MFLVVTSAPAITTVCPPGEFAIVGNKSFYWDATNTKYEDARISCPENATLAVVDSAAEMEALKDKGELGKQTINEKETNSLLHIIHQRELCWLYHLV